MHIFQHDVGKEELIGINLYISHVIFSVFSKYAHLLFQRK